MGEGDAEGEEEEEGRKSEERTVVYCRWRRGALCGREEKWEVAIRSCVFVAPREGSQPRR